MRILLVYPEMPDTFYAFKHFIKVVGKKAAFPPLGLLTVSSMLPTEWEKKLIDLNVTPLTDEDIQWADYVFLSAMNVQEESVREIIKQCNKNNTKIVAGGPLFTHEYDRFEGVDYFVLNEAEITLPLFLNDLKENKPLPIYKTPEFPDVTATPAPALELVDMNNYMYAIIQYSRGCPYLCDFCDVTALFGRRPRTKTSEQIIAELDDIHQSGNIQLVLFADDNMIGNKVTLKKDLLPALIEWRKKRNPGFFFATQLTINLADDEELMQLLLDAGFRHVFIGIETPQEDSLKSSNKNQNLKRNLLDTIRKIHEKGFMISAGFIVGFDTDNERSFQNMVDFIQESGIPLPIVNVLKAPPGTELFERMKREDRLSRRFAFSEGETNIKPVMGEALLNKGFISVIDNLYTHKHSYERLKNFFMSYHFPVLTSKVAVKTPTSFILSVAKGLIKLGVFDKDRYYFWKLIIWTFFYNRKFVDKAIFYAIMMYQMRENHSEIIRKMDKYEKSLQEAA